MASRRAIDAGLAAAPALAPSRQRTWWPPTLPSANVQATTSRQLVSLRGRSRAERRNSPAITVYNLGVQATTGLKMTAS